MVDNYGVKYYEDGSVLISCPASLEGKYVVGEECTLIKEDAFYECDKITEVVLPDGLQTIDTHAFWGCESLRYINIPNGVQTIGYGTFWGCSDLDYIDLPDSIETIEGGAFHYCDKLRSIRVPEGVKEIDTDTFAVCVNLLAVVLPSTITSIRCYAFNGDTRLRHLHIHSKCPEFIEVEDDAFEDYIFDNCTLYVPKGTTTTYRHHPFFGKFVIIREE